MAEAFPFREDSLLEAAKQATGLSDFAGEGFREGLRVLLETFERTADFSEKGRKRNWRRLVQLLTTRLRVQAALARHPEIRQREIRRPLYLTGLPRTGTSALFNLLGADPAARPLLLWEAVFPDPLEDLPAGEPDPRYLAIKQQYDRKRERNPEFTNIHFALPMPEAVEQALRAHVAAHPQGKHGRHEYSLEEFGLDADAVRTHLAGYIDRFALPCDP